MSFGALNGGLAAGLGCEDRLSGARLEMANAGSALTLELLSESSTCTSPQRTDAAVATIELPVRMDWPDAVDADSSDSEVSLSGSVGDSESTEAVPAWWDWSDASSERDSDSDNQDSRSSWTAALQSTEIAGLSFGSWDTATFEPMLNAQSQVAAQSPELTSRSVRLAYVGVAEPPRAGNAGVTNLESRAKKRPRSSRSDSHV